MKKLSFLLLVFSLFTTANAQIINFADPDFKIKLVAASSNNFTAKNLSGKYFNIDANNDGEIQESEALQVGFLEIYNENIDSLVGIEKFINLKSLKCTSCGLNSLNLEGLTNLQTLDIERNLLTSLNLTGLTNLQTLSCSNNRLTTLNLTGLTNLQSVNCYNNKLISLNVNGLKNIENLSCSKNSISTLDLSSLNKLDNLQCENNLITNLYFLNSPNLQVLYCSYNQLTNLNFTNSKYLTELHCNNNYLSSIDFDNYNLNYLELLYCADNRITALNLTNFYNLTFVDCQNNRLKNLSIQSGSKLYSIDCSRNQLTNLTLSNLSALFSVNASSNLLNSITLNKLPSLFKLLLYENQLSVLDLSNLDHRDGKLQYLSLGSNLLTAINMGSINYVIHFSLMNNRLTDLSFMPKYEGAEFFSCSQNLINSINIKAPARIFDCSNNPVTSLAVSGYMESFKCENTLLENIDLSDVNVYSTSFSISNNKFLKSLNIKNGQTINSVLLNNCPNIKFICADDAELVHFQNVIIYLGLTNCVVNSYCSFTPGGDYYTIQGNQKLDSNANGCDALDIVVPNLKFTIANGSKTGSLISNTSGNYSIPVQAGTHTISPKLENLTYFTVSPTTVNVTFPTQTSPFTQNFCITPNGVRPDLEVTLLPLVPARPGFDAKYKLVYKNKGNTIQSGSVNLGFTDSVLDLIVANPIATSQTTNNLSWNFTPLQPFETREITFTMNVNSPMETPAVNNGDILGYTATISSVAIDETPTDNTFTFNQTVVGSYDPNDKTCLEGSVITPNLIGQYVHYNIRFENTGTFAAENVVVKDMIDLTKFDISTLVPTSASHSYTTRISEGNKVEFIFENINLPFDDANNDGYIAFKIKTKPTLVVNDSFSNEASIFFDYNFPIVTNKATSTFKTLGTQDFDFDRYFTVYPNPATTVLNITTKESINTESMQVYNTLGQLVLAIPNAKKVSNVDVSNLKSGNYFIQIKTDKGSSSSQFVKE